MLVNFMIEDSAEITVATFDREMTRAPQIGEFVKYRGQSYFVHAIANILQGEDDDKNDFMRVWMAETIHAPVESIG